MSRSTLSASLSAQKLEGRRQIRLVESAPLHCTQRSRWSMRTFLALSFILGCLSCGKGSASAGALVTVKALPVVLRRIVSPANVPKWIAELATGSDVIETQLGTITMDPSRLLGQLIHEGTIFTQVSSPAVILVDKDADQLVRWDLGPDIERIELVGSAVDRFKMDVLNSEPFQVLLWVDGAKNAPLEVTARLVLRTEKEE